MGPLRPAKGLEPVLGPENLMRSLPRECWWSMNFKEALLPILTDLRDGVRVGGAARASAGVNLVGCAEMGGQLTGLKGGLECEFSRLLDGLTELRERSVCFVMDTRLEKRLRLTRLKTTISQEAKRVGTGV